jgi:hypothetical protein
MNHSDVHIWIQLGGLSLAGVIVGAILGGSLVAGYRLVDKDRGWPTWADALAIGTAHGLAIVCASGVGHFLAPDLPDVGTRLAITVTGLSALVGPGLWPHLRARGLAMLDRKIGK